MVVPLSPSAHLLSGSARRTCRGSGSNPAVRPRIMMLECYDHQESSPEPVGEGQPMCGRYTLRAKPAAVAEEFDLPEVPRLRPRFNIAPDHPVAVVRFDPSEGSRRLDFLTWGLIPSWADDPGIGDRLINARAETVAEKPAFRHPFRTRRCLVVADGFYEWQRQDGWKRPFFVHMRDDRPFAFAGLWEHWEKGESRSTPAPC